MRLCFRVILPGLATAAVLAACSGGGTAPPATEQGAQSTAKAPAVDTPFSYSVHPKLRRVTDLLSHNCPNGTTGCALSPTTVRTAYNFSYINGTQDGGGNPAQKIVVVVAYGSPTIQTDLATFSTQFGLPQANLTIVYPGGKPTVNLSNAVQLGWAEETSLDVEWAHAAAPGAAIILVVGNNDQGQTIQSTLQYAVATYPNSAMSLSFGTPEASINGGANNTQLKASIAIYQMAAANNITVIASAGDLGATNGFANANPQYPASDKNVLGVGGTSLTLFSNGKYRSESAWNDGISCAQPCGATGGARSNIFASTVAQATLTGDSQRDVPDVAFDAGDNAVDVYIGFSSPTLGVSSGWYSMGGTSVGPPIYAGIVAVANQLRQGTGTTPRTVGYVNDWLYSQYTTAQTTKTPPFHDVVSGNNAFLPSGSPFNSAAPGYDLTTGLGTPNTNNLLSVLVAKP